MCIFYVAYKGSVEKTGLYIGRVHLLASEETKGSHLAMGYLDQTAYIISKTPKFSFCVHVIQTLSGVGHSSVIRFESPKTGFYLSLSFFSVLIEHRQLVFVVLSGSAILPPVLAAVIQEALIADLLRIVSLEKVTSFLLHLSFNLHELHACLLL